MIVQAMGQFWIEEQLRIEQSALVKAAVDIAEGQIRLHDQEVRLDRLRHAGHDIRQAERLVALFGQILEQWEQHQALIRQRIVYLQDRAAPLAGAA